MPKVKKLPTRSEFLRKNIKVADNCGICHESFSATHKPALMTSSECNHIFGVVCLRKWSKSDNDHANARPLCREELFVKPREPYFSEVLTNHRNKNGHWLSAIRDRNVAELFVRNLWQALYDRPIYTYYAIWECDIEMALHATLRADKYGYPTGRCLPFDDWPAMKAVAENMIKTHYANKEFRPLTSRQLAYKWMPAMNKVLGWSFQYDQNIGHEDGDEESDLEEA
jgi:hypothetical protein